MTYDVANLGHAQWQSFDHAQGTDNAAQLSIVTTPLPTGLAYTHIIKFAPHASQGGVNFANYGTPTNIAAPSSNHIIWHGYLRWTDLSPATEYEFLQIRAATGYAEAASAVALFLETDGDIRVTDDNNATIATITTPLTVDTWHRFEIRGFPNGTTGELQIWIDGVEVLANQTSQDTGTFARWDFTSIVGPPASSGDMFFAGSAVFVNSTAATDRIDDDFEIVGPYTSQLASQTPDTGPGSSTDTPGTGADTTAGNWSLAGEVPPSSSNIVSYDGTPEEGGVHADDGPSGDANVDGDSNIVAMQAVFITDFGTGGTTTHTVVAGNDSDEYDAAATFTTIADAINPTILITTAATAMPLSTENCLLGFGVSGAKDFDMHDMAAFLLHVPSAGATTVDMATGTYTFSGNASTVSFNVTVAMDAGSYTFTGNAAGIVVDSIAAMDAGSYTFSGLDPTVSFNVPVAMDAGSYTFSGLDPTIVEAFFLSMNTGSYTLSGLDPVVTRHLLANMDTGAFTFAGLDPAITLSTVVDMDTGTYTFSGLDPAVARQIPVAMDLATYTFSGLDPTVARQIPVLMDTGALTFSGLDPTVIVDHISNMDTGTYTFSGLDITIPLNVPVAMDAGSYTFSGLDPTVSFNVDVAMDAGTFALSGLAATTTRDLLFNMDTGSYTFSGLDPTVLRHIPVAMELATYTFNGFDMTATVNRPITPDTGSFTLTGHDPTVIVDRVANMDTGAFTLTGHDPVILENQQVPMDLATFTFAGLDLAATRQIPVLMDTGAFTFSGFDPTVIVIANPAGGRGRLSLTLQKLGEP